jgi:hypothetical protein
LSVPTQDTYKQTFRDDAIIIFPPISFQAGYCGLNFKKEPGKYREKNNLSALKQMDVLKDKVAEWVREGHVEKLAEPPWCTNPMSVAAKYDPVKDETKLRPVIDLSRHVNKCVKDSHVKLDDLSLAEELIAKGDYMASFDLANQFFHVKLNPADRKFFGFALPSGEGKSDFFQFTVMAYGYSPAVEVVTRLLKPVKAYLHQLGIKLSIFVDNGRVSAAGKQETWEKFEFVLTTLQLCGWNIQWKKTSTKAVQSLLHLGFVTDSVQLRYFLPAEKEKAVLDMLQQTIAFGSTGRPVLALELAKLLGKLNSMRRLQGPTLGVLSRTCQHLLGINVLERGWQSTVQLTYEAVRELSFLADRLVELNGQHIFLGGQDQNLRAHRNGQTDQPGQVFRRADVKFVCIRRLRQPCLYLQGRWAVPVCQGLRVLQQGKLGELRLQGSPSGPKNPRVRSWAFQGVQRRDNLLADRQQELLQFPIPRFKNS